MTWVAVLLFRPKLEASMEAADIRSDNVAKNPCRTLYNTYRYCTAGWVDFGLFYIFNKSTPWDLLHTLQKYQKLQKKNKFLTQW
jgi:hypothetical protein